MTDTETGASAVRVMDHFYGIPYLERCGSNWGTDTRAGGVSIWDIPDSSTYINGIMLTIDHDYEMGYLLEVCDRSEDGETYVSHLMIADSPWGRDCEWVDHRPYPFFKRPDNCTAFDLHDKFINWYECLQEIRREHKDKEVR